MSENDKKNSNDDDNDLFLKRYERGKYLINKCINSLNQYHQNNNSYLGYTIPSINYFTSDTTERKKNFNYKSNVGDNKEALDRVYNPDNTKRVGHTPWSEIMKKALKNREGISYGESAPDKVNKEVNEMIRNNKKVTRVSGTVESIFKESVASNAESIWLKRECNTCGSEFMYLQLNGARVVHNCNVCVTEEVAAMFTKFDNENID